MGTKTAKMADHKQPENEEIPEKSENESDSLPVNKFQNDGSFMEMFRKRMAEEEKKKTEEEAPKIKKSLPMVGKRRGGNVALKTGAVKKKKTEEEDDAPSDAWAKYMKEVKKYKDQSCQEEDKTRPLVK